MANGVDGAIAPERAARAVGRGTTVWGRPANVYFTRNGNGQPAFVDFGAPHPDENLAVVIFGDDRAGFAPPSESWMGRPACVTGLIKNHKGRAEVVAYGPDRIRFPPD